MHRTAAAMNAVCCWHKCSSRFMLKNSKNMPSIKSTKNSIITHRHHPQCKLTIKNLVFLIAFVCIISCFNINIVSCFNLEARLPIVKFGIPNTYFGYSVATHIIGEEDLPDSPENEKWLLVGAPLGQNYQPDTNHSGALFKCPITQKSGDCVQVITDGRRSIDSDDHEDLHSPLVDDEIKDGQWLGVTVRSQGLGGKVLVCAHRYITKKGESQYGQGLCYVLTNDLKYDEIYEPCKGRTVQRAHEDYGYCQAGTSGALLDDNTMVLGSPGPFTWRGTIFVTEIGGEYLKRDKNMYYGDHSEKGSPVDKYSYLGMAVTGGRYFSQKMSYAAGAPRSNGHGQVIVFDKSSSNPIPYQLIIEGEQFGSSFGYELATADVNGDRLPDLLVAAPFYFTKADGGAVYVFLNEDNTLPKKWNQKFTGKLESRFGLAIANIGDLNKDECEDVAIGAPYEANGVVYIYLGSEKGLRKKPAQIITPSEMGLLNTPIKTFGSSLAGGIDLDGNSYPDVVIGAYNSSAVFALLARPITNIKTHVVGDELTNIDPNRPGCPNDPSTNFTCFSFQACCSIDPYENNPRNRLNLMYTIEAETFNNNKKFSRVFFDRENKRSNIIKRNIQVETNGRQICTLETAYIKDNKGDIQSPIKFRLNYTIIEQGLPNSGLEYLNPILDQTQADRIFDGTFHKDCGDDDICESRMEMKAVVALDEEDLGYVLILGKNQEVALSVNVSNSADSAYEAQLYVVHQPRVTYIAATKSTTAICSRFNETIVACDLGNPMKRDAFSQISLRFDPSGIEDSETKLNFRVFVNTTSNMIGPIPETNLKVNVIKSAKLSAQGWARPEQSFYGGEVKGESAMVHFEDIGTEVEHIYQIYNDGPWKAPRVTVDILWPHQVANDKKQGKWLLYLEKIPTIEFIGAAGFGECYVNDDDVNPLNLTSKPTTPDAPNLLAPEAYAYRPESSISMNKSRLSSSYFVNHKDSVSEKNSSNDEIILNRVRRDYAKIIRAERYTDKDGKKTDVVLMDCESKTAFCIKIHCDIFNMPRKTEAYINIKARLWNSTLVADYPRVDLVRIVSTARVEIPKEYAVEQSEVPEKFSVETRAYPELLDQVRDTSTPLWIIIVSVLSGLVVLAILAFVMWKCGFFKRRRPDPTLSGNLEKNSENKPFIQS